ncbi:MAG: class I SAM-dependent methyltransferase [Acidobacteria bacterium]|nr:class I SAM-dependent methyltransferase [Acidobacteriota bacterium]MYE44124.1 class I SAM-dependent methyltransferase [Acidobacteriota bacterium]
MIAEPGRLKERGNLARKRGSRTAEMVAAARAGHFARGERPLVTEDPYAIHLAGERWQRVIGSSWRHWLVTRVLLRKVIPTTTFVLIRTRFTDDRVLAAAARGVHQLVILGAGFDTFALRHPDLGIRVFEVDLPASAALKRERLANAGIAVPEHLHFVEVDFERDRLDDRLLAAGFDRQAPAFFSWMGVTYYLAPEAVTGTLARITGLSAPGSELTLDYLNIREGVPADELALFDSLLRFVEKHGEPMITRFGPVTVVEELGLDTGWDVLEHEFPTANPERHLGERKDLPRVAPLFRLLHLRRT